MWREAVFSLSSNDESLESVLFLGAGYLGWATMAESLRLSLQESGSQHDEISGPISALRQRQLRPQIPNLIYRSLHRVADPAFRARTWNLETALQRQQSTPKHVHCFGHLVAVPEIFENRDMTYSVTADHTWARSYRELYRPQRMMTPSTAHRRIKAESKVFEKATFVHCTSKWAAESVIFDYQIDPDKVLVKTFPIVDTFPSISGETERKWLTFIGNDFKRKGGHRLIAWHQDRLRDSIELHIISGHEPIKNIRSLRNVVWHGPVANQKVRDEILPQTKLLALPTSIDQSPLVLIEAAASGVPALSTDIAGISEIVVDGRTGSLVSPKASDDQAADQLHALLSDPETLQRFGDQARTHYLKKLKAQSTIDALVARIKGGSDELQMQHPVLRQNEGIVRES